MNFIASIVYPPRCIFCGKVMEPNSKITVCEACGRTVQFCSDETCCDKCGKPIVSFGSKKLCYFCINKKAKYFDRIVSSFVYETKVKDAIVKFKKTGLKLHTSVFAECVTARIFEEYPDIKFDFLCGVPPHKGKEVDQVGLLSSLISKKLKIPYRKNLFKFIRKVKKQSTLGYMARTENVKNSLKVKSKYDLTGATVLLIDDICTTRSTLSEAARALKASGAKNVYAATVATVRNPD